MEKPYHLYTALTKAVDNYNDRHFLNRGFFADVLNYKGESAARQFSAALNTNNYEKTINDNRKKILLNTMDDEARRVFFTEWMRQWGLKPCSLYKPESFGIVALNILVDDAQIEADESFKTAKLALRDETLTSKELKDIIKEATEAMQKQEQIVGMAHARLEEMVKNGEDE